MFEWNIMLHMSGLPIKESSKFSIQSVDSSGYLGCKTLN